MRSVIFELNFAAAVHSYISTVRAEGLNLPRRIFGGSSSQKRCRVVKNQHGVKVDASHPGRVLIYAANWRRVANSLTKPRSPFACERGKFIRHVDKTNVYCKRIKVSFAAKYLYLSQTYGVKVFWYGTLWNIAIEVVAKVKTVPVRLAASVTNSPCEYIRLRRLKNDVADKVLPKRTWCRYQMPMDVRDVAFNQFECLWRCELTNH